MTLGVCPPDLLGQNLVLDVDGLGRGPNKSRTVNRARRPELTRSVRA
jgi:hypothetical protein